MVKISVSIDVSNLKKGEEFYTKALGCTKVRDQMGMSIISVKNCEIYLQEKKQDSIAVPKTQIKRDFSRHWNPIHLDFLCSDIDEKVKLIEELGGKKEGGESWGGGSIAYCVDPFGNGFCLINE
jgi:predicted enzyme related to lactoylglutathione lyase